ncbi:centromere protein V-like [Clavelina lepadiformis]|uniref:centromere protein V-like n=1 Tax=Clavelina lepadiformis TaxID=159417 RepID=UPI0040424925
MTNNEKGDVLHSGGCHCAAVRFQVHAPADVHIYNCNCSICYVKSNQHFIVPAQKFELLQGKELLTTYTFNTHKAKHMFCKVCGVQSFYIPRSNPDGYGINPRCIDKGTIENMIVENFNGVEWESSMQVELQKPVSIQSRSK